LARCQYRGSATKQSTLPADLSKFIGGGSNFSYNDDSKCYPLGKIESGSSVTVFIAATSMSYKTDYNTQISLDAYSYNKKTGVLIRGALHSYLFSVGGNPVSNTFMYTGKVETGGKTWLKVYQTGSGTAVIKQHAYKISGKGLTFDKEF